MVFHGDYEIEFEIHKERIGDWRTECLGHMPGLTAQDALDRWVERHDIQVEDTDRLHAIPIVSCGKI